MLHSFENNLPRRVIFGRGHVQKLPAELLRWNANKIGIVTDSGVVRAGLLTRLTAPLTAAGLAFSVYDQTEPEPPFSCVTAAVAHLAAAGGADVIVALGGGSVMDTAKLVAATLRDGRDARTLAGIGKVGRRTVPLTCVPTTAGTGSEATAVAIFTDAATSNKVGVVDSCLVPDLVVLDPELTDGLPPHVTAAAGMDALVHALEAFIARVATPLARGLALEAARHLGPALPIACRDGRVAAARDSMLLGANLAGLAFANSSCCGAHALALPVGGRFHLAHGVLTGTLVAETMRHNLPACEADFRVFAAALGWNDDPAQFPAQLAAQAQAIGLNAALRTNLPPPSSVPELARAAVAIRRLMDPNPRPITESDATRIYCQTFGYSHV